MVVRDALSLDREWVCGILVGSGDPLNSAEVRFRHFESALGECILAVVPEARRSLGNGEKHVEALHQPKETEHLFRLPRDLLNQYVNVGDVEGLRGPFRDFRKGGRLSVTYLLTHGDGD